MQTPSKHAATFCLVSYPSLMQRKTTMPFSLKAGARLGASTGLDPVHQVSIVIILASEITKVKMNGMLQLLQVT